MGLELKALDKIILDSANLGYLFGNINNKVVQIPMVSLFGDQMPLGIVFSEDIPDEEIEEDQFYAVGANGVYDNFIAGTYCHAGGRWYRTEFGWNYIEPYWYNNSYSGTIEADTGEDISFFTPVYIGANGLVYKWTPVIGLQNKIVGITRSSALAGYKIVIVLDSGKIAGCAGLIKGDVYYSNMDGVIINEYTNEEIFLPLGNAIQETVFLVKLGNPIITII